MTHTKLFVKGIIDKHIQISHFSCVPSSVEMTLKLLDKVSVNFYDFQERCNINGGCFTDFDGLTINGVTFTRINLANRGPNFPFNQLFAIIDQEIAEERYVMIALEGTPGYHGYVIYGKDQANDSYLCVTKTFSGNRCVTLFDTILKNRIENIGGTDILTYTTT